MRTIFLLRGTPASGKSTWVEQNIHCLPTILD